MKKNLLLFLCIMLLMVGCTHNLRLTNQEAIKPSQVRPAKAVKIGFAFSDDPLINSVIEETSMQSMVKEVKKGYKVGSDEGVDYVSELTNSITYSAYGQNFFITFPGFILFTHSWLGYKYNMNIDTQSKILDPKGKVLSEQKITTPYDYRFTSFPRGAAASLVGWITPGWGVLDIIPGIMFATSYDDRGNQELMDKVKPTFGASVSSKLLEQIAAVQNNAPSTQISNNMDNIVVDNKPNTEITKPNITPSSDVGTQSKSHDSSEYAQKLRELKKLKDEGLLNDTEYEQKRKAIADGI